MSELDQVISKAYENEGEQEFSNKVYATFFRSELFMPIYSQDNKEEPFVPLTLEEEGNYFIPIFDSLLRLEEWIGEEYPDLEYAEIMGNDVIRGIGVEKVYLSLNPGTEFYKEFSPEELVRLKMMLAKIDKFKEAGNDSAKK